MWFLLSESFWAWVVLGGFCYFVVMMVKGLRGVRLDDYMYCVGCDYCLHGQIMPKLCVECGADLYKRGATRRGRWAKRGGYIVRGVIVFGLCFACGVGVALIPSSVKPVGWLMADLDRVHDAVLVYESGAKALEEDGGDGYGGYEVSLLMEDVGYDSIWEDLGRRVKAGLLGEGEVDELLDFALSHVRLEIDFDFDDDSDMYYFYEEPMNAALWGFISEMRELGRLGDAAELKLYRGMIDFKLKGRSRVPVEMTRYLLKLELGVWYDYQDMVGGDDKMTLSLVMKGIELDGAVLGYDEVVPLDDESDRYRVEVPGYRSREGEYLLDFGAIREAGEGVHVLSARVEVVMQDEDGIEVGRWTEVYKHEVEVMGDESDLVLLKDEKYLAGIYDSVKVLSFEQYVCSKDHHHFNPKFYYLAGDLDFDLALDVFAVDEAGKEWYLETVFMGREKDEGDDVAKASDDEGPEAGDGYDDIDGFVDGDWEKSLGRHAWLVGKQFDLLMRVNLDAGLNHSKTGRLWGGKDLLFKGVEVVETEKGK